MKKQDFLFVFTLIVIFLPFFVSDALYDWYKSFNAAHGMIMSFVKFGVLATLGEILGLRISSGVYNRKGFGVLPRAVVWGLLGMGINMAMIVFSKGVPQFMEYMGMENASSIINGEFCLDKLWVALAISVTMNTIFAPVFMTFHKITDTHILDCGGIGNGVEIEGIDTLKIEKLTTDSLVLNSNYGYTLRYAKEKSTKP